MALRHACRLSKLQILKDALLSSPFLFIYFPRGCVLDMSLFHIIAKKSPLIACSRRTRSTHTPFNNNANYQNTYPLFSYKGTSTTTLLVWFIRSVQVVSVSFDMR